jgi:hypothetical protein
LNILSHLLRNPYISGFLSAALRVLALDFEEPTVAAGRPSEPIKGRVSDLINPKPTPDHELYRNFALPIDISRGSFELGSLLVEWIEQAFGVGSPVVFDSNHNRIVLSIRL